MKSCGPQGEEAVTTALVAVLVTGVLPEHVG
jgi:hypothetical protein